MRTACAVCASPSRLCRLLATHSKGTSPTSGRWCFPPLSSYGFSSTSSHAAPSGGSSLLGHSPPLAAFVRFLVLLPSIGAFVGYRALGVDVARADEKASSASDPDDAPSAAAREKADEKDRRDAAVLARELPPYTPDFTKAFEWFCVHTGGRAVIDAIENNLALPSHYLEPSRLSLYRYGNVSSASIWYELELISEFGSMCGAQRNGGTLPPPDDRGRRLRKGDRIWQIAFGSGFKCNSMVWQCLKNH